MGSLRVAAVLLVTVIMVPASVAGQAQFAVVRSFDGSEPIEPQFAPQLRATDGNSYGTTVRGGPVDAGTVVRLASDGTVTLLYAFTGGSDGASPSAGLTQGTDGHLYGTTERGGTADAGTVFRMTLAGSFTVLHRFAYTDGANPGPLVQGSDGNLYGTTRNGGDFLAGTIFRITPAGVVTVLHSFTGGADGGSPRSGLIQAPDGRLYGTTDTGGALGMGTAFRLDAVAPPQGVFTIRGGGDLDWVPSAGGFGPTIASSPTSASGTLLDPHGSAAYTIAAGPGVVRGSLAGSFTDLGRFNPSIQADASSELTLVGPTGFVAIPVSLNLHVDSTFTIEQCPDSCNVSIGVIGHGGITRFSIGAGFTENGLGLTADPIPGGYHLHGDVATPQFGLTPNLPTSVGISLQINDNNLNHGYAGASVFAVGPSIVSFAPSGPVLNGVPAGYTVSGPGVVDNHWTDPLVPDIELQFDDGTPMPANPVVDLGNVASGSVVEGGYRIANTGIAPLEVTDVAAELLAAGVAEAPVPTNSTIAPGDSTPAVVRCGGTNPGPDAREVMFDVKISSDDPDESPVYFRVRCTVLPEPVGRPIIELRFADGTPMPANAELDLGEVASGSVAEGSYLIANIGDGRLQVADVQVARYSAFGVTEASLPTNPSIDPGGATAALVRCGGTNPDPAARSLYFDVSVSGGGLVSLVQAGFRVRCTVLPAPVQTPDIELRFADGTPMPAGNPIFDLGDVPSGSVKPGAYRIANMGDVSLEVTDITHDTPASGIALAPSLSASIAPGGSSLAPLGCGGPNADTTPLTVEFSVAVHSNDPDEGSAQFTVRCRVLPAPIVPPPPGPDIELRLADGRPMGPIFDLGFVDSGSVLTRDFEIGNIGDASLLVSDYQVNPANGSIHPSGIDASTVLAGGRTLAHVTCQGVYESDDRFSFSNRSGTLTIISNDPDEGTISVAVHCSIRPTPTVPRIELRYNDGTPMSGVPTIDLGTVTHGSVATGHYQIHNSGGHALTVFVRAQMGQGSPDSGIDAGPVDSISVAPHSTYASGLFDCFQPLNNPTFSGSMTAVVLVYSDDPDKSSPFSGFRIACTILPAPPDIELRFADGTPMPANATIDLGEVASGAEVHGTFNVANVGSGPLQIGGVTIYHSPPYIDDANMFNYSAIAAGQTAAGSVKCGSSNPGAVPVTHSVYVTVVSNDPDEGTVNFTVHCTVLPEPRPDIELRFANGTPMPANAILDLGAVASDAEVHGTFNVANVGSGPLQIGGVTIYHSPPYIDDANMFNYSAIAAGQTAAGSVKCGSSNPGAAPVIHSVYVTVVSNDPDEGTVSFSVHCTVLPEAVPPTITAIAAPGRNANGWNNTNVTVSYTCTDLGPGLNSGVDQAASSLGDDVLTASGTATGTCVDRAGNSASASYTAQIDKTVPTLGFQGNAGTYSVLATVAITCIALDPLSGVASTNCQNASGPAWSFGAGPHTLSANATDRAGNTGSASTTFTVIVNPAGLTALTRQFVQSSARYQALRMGQRAAVDAVVTAACNLLLNIRPALAPAQKAQFINAYKQAVQALVAPGWLTATQAVTLRALADAI